MQSRNYHIDQRARVLAHKIKEEEDSDGDTLGGLIECDDAGSQYYALQRSVETTISQA